MLRILWFTKSWCPVLNFNLLKNLYYICLAADSLGTFFRKSAEWVFINAFRLVNWVFKDLFWSDNFLALGKIGNQVLSMQLLGFRCQKSYLSTMRPFSNPRRTILRVTQNFAGRISMDGMLRIWLHLFWNFKYLTGQNKMLRTQSIAQTIKMLRTDLRVTHFLLLDLFIGVRQKLVQTSDSACATA